MFNGQKLQSMLGRWEKWKERGRGIMNRFGVRVFTWLDEF